MSDPQRTPRTLLAVLAHPDDESFGTGGTLALYAQSGAAVYLVCATRGEAGEIDPRLMQGFDSVAARREAELRCAAEHLALTGVYFLDYRDSGMPGAADNGHPRALASQPVEEVAARVAEHIRLLRPQVVVTFDPIGGYKHPDHVAIHKATLRAFHLAGDAGFASETAPYQPQKLYYSVSMKGLARFVARVAPLVGMDPRRFGRNQDIDLKAIAEEGNFPIHARVDYRAVIERKEAASACHASQLWGGAPRQGMFRWFLRLLGTSENYMRAFPPAEPGLSESDLFEGVSYEC